MMFRLLNVCAVCAFLLASCANRDFIKPDQVQIDAYIQEHPDLPEIDKSCIYDGRFEIGITQETLFFLLGEPFEKESIKQPWALQERWKYKRKNQKIFVIEDRHVVGILEEEK
jgi:hypothetical protein